MDKFKTWSESNREAYKFLRPDLGLICWNNLNNKDKHNIWIILVNKGWFKSSNAIINSVLELNERFKKNMYALKSLEHGGPHIKNGYIQKCCLDIYSNDFKTIIFDQNENVVLELITLYAKGLINYRLLDKIKKNEVSPENIDNEINDAYSTFDSFTKDFNEVLEHFGLNLILSRSGFIPKQEKLIIDQIYIPVLTILSDPHWALVSRDLNEAFRSYNEKTSSGYSNCITYAVSSLQAFLQIVVNNKIGKGEINQLLEQAQKQMLIPNDVFSKKILKDLESSIMAERQKKGDPHPKEEYANEKHARLVLNLVMIFIQHCIQI